MTKFLLNTNICPVEIKVFCSTGCKRERFKIKGEGLFDLHNPLFFFLTSVLSFYFLLVFHPDNRSVEQDYCIR